MIKIFIYKINDKKYFFKSIEDVVDFIGEKDPDIRNHLINHSEIERDIDGCEFIVHSYCNCRILCFDFEENEEISFLEYSGSFFKTGIKKAPSSSFKMAIDFMAKLFNFYVKNNDFINIEIKDMGNYKTRTYTYFSEAIATDLMSFTDIYSIIFN